MNLFQYQGQEEDHYTNILMNILGRNSCQLVNGFLKALIPEQASKFNFQDLHLDIRKKYCPREIKKYEFIIGVAPYKQAINNRNTYEDNSGSIPDAWICGENFNLLFEFKIRGTLDESQLSAHQKLLGEGCEIIRLQWTHVISALKTVYIEDESIEEFLISQFLEVTETFKSKRKASGMPKQIISNVNKENDLHFIITGSSKLKVYTVEQVYNDEKVMLNNTLKGIQEARRFIANYVFNNKDQILVHFDGLYTEISDYCVVPGRAQNKNQWNQWRLGAFMHTLIESLHHRNNFYIYNRLVYVQLP